MPRTTNANVDVSDLQFVVRHLIRLAYSKTRVFKDKSIKSSSDLSQISQRRELLRIADQVEILDQEALLNYPPADWATRVDAVCADLSALITKNLSSAAIGRLRTSVRQQRHTAGLLRDDEIYRAYIASSR